MKQASLVLSLALALGASVAPAHAGPWKIQMPTPMSCHLGALSPTGHRLLLAGCSGPLLVVDTANGQIVDALKMPVREFTDIGWMPDGRSVVIGNRRPKQDRPGDNSRNIIIVAPTGKPTYLPGYQRKILPSPSGRWLVSMDYESPSVIEVATKKNQDWVGERSRNGKVPLSHVKDYAWSSAGELLILQDAYSDDEASIRRFQLDRRKELPRIALPPYMKPAVLALSPSGEIAAVGMTNGRLIIIDVPRGTVVSNDQVAAAEIRALAIDDFGRLAMLADGMLTVSSLQTKAVLQAAPASTNPTDPGSAGRLFWYRDRLLLVGVTGVRDTSLRAEIIAVPRDPEAERHLSATGSQSNQETLIGSFSGAVGEDAVGEFIVKKSGADYVLTYRMNQGQWSLESRGYPASSRALREAYMEKASLPDIGLHTDFGYLVHVPKTAAACVNFRDKCLPNETGYWLVTRSAMKSIKKK